MKKVSDKEWSKRLFNDDYSPIFYTHYYFGPGYLIIDYDKKDNWCTLQKISKDGSKSICMDYYNNLIRE